MRTILIMAIIFLIMSIFNPMSKAFVEMMILGVGTFKLVECAIEWIHEIKSHPNHNQNKV